MIVGTKCALMCFSSTQIVGIPGESRGRRDLGQRLRVQLLRGGSGGTGGPGRGRLPRLVPRGTGAAEARQTQPSRQDARVQNSVQSLLPG